MQTFFDDAADPEARVPIVNLNDLSSVKVHVLITSLVRSDGAPGQDEDEDARRCLLATPITSGIIVGAKSRLQKVWSQDVFCANVIDLQRVIHVVSKL
jgi:hypothetical protein